MACATALCGKVKLMVGKLLKDGAKYERLKGGVVRVDDGVCLAGDMKCADEFIRLLRLSEAKGSSTPVVTKLFPGDEEQPFDEEDINLCRQRVGIARYTVNYVTEAAFAVHVLSKRLSKPAISDVKRLKQFGRYLRGVRDYAPFFPRAGEIHVLERCADSAWAGDATDRKSVACGVMRCGGCALLEYSRGQNARAR